jgi:hypothetical protein
MALKLAYDTIDEVPEAHRELYTEKDGKHHFTGVEGMKTAADVEAVHTGLRKERDEHKTTKAKYAGYTKLVNPETNAPFEKPEDLQAILDELPTLRASAEAGGGKSAEAVTKQVEAHKKTLEGTLGREITTLKDTNAKLQAKVAMFEDDMRVAAIRNTVMTAITDSKIGKFEPDAIEDALMYAERHMEVDEERDAETGDLIIKGVRTRDGVGVTPGLEAAAWLSEMQPKKGHWYLPSEGTGPTGNRGNNGGGNNPWSASNWNLTAQGAYFKQYGRDKAEQMAKAAGTTIGGPPPAAAKGKEPVVQPRRSARR